VSSKKKKASKVRIRKSVFTLGKAGDDLDWYGKAVAELKKRPLSDSSGWRYLAAVHGYPGTAADPFATPGEKTPSNSEQQRFWNQCQHQSWYFLPWHRGYLACFEEIIAATVVKLGGPAGWALPYWNYSDSKDTDARKLPSAFLAGAAANPLFTPGRKMATKTAELPIGHISLSALLYSPFSMATMGAHPGFGGPMTGFSHFGGTNGLLESLPHNVIHDNVGGLMSDPNTAALDPIFWLHHSNIDRLWEVWTHRDPKFTTPKVSAWLKEKFELHDASGKVVTFTPAQMLDTTKVRHGYRYDDISDPFAKPTVAAPSAPEPRVTVLAPQLVGASQPNIAVSGARTTAEVPFNQPARQAAMSRFAVKRPVKAYLNIENVTGSGIHGTYDVYIDVPHSGKPATDTPLLAGHLSTFGVREASRSDSPHGGSGITSVLDISSIVEQLHRERGWNGSQLDVSFVPSGPSDAERAPPQATLRIGRISVYYA
jgi:tyrosinase